MAEFPAGSITIIDAWFGFQPTAVLDAHVALAGLTNIAEVWCHAPPDIIGERYLSRVAARPPGHLGADYVPELVALAARAQPTGKYPVATVDTSRVFAIGEIVESVRRLLDCSAG